MNQLILNADDLGICESTNEAILQAFVDGELDSASLMVTTAGWQHAVETVIRPHADFSIGLHLSLTSGTCVSPARDLPGLVDRGGSFHRGFGSLWNWLTWGGEHARKQVERELAAQFQRFGSLGIRLNHVDGHRHVHMIPAVFPIVSRLAREYNAGRVRVSCEPFPRVWQLIRDGRVGNLLRNLPKQLLLRGMGWRNRRHLAGLVAAEETYGIIDSGQVDLQALQRIAARKGAGIAEVITHPGAGESSLLVPLIPKGDLVFLRSPLRRLELETLLAPALRELRPCGKEQRT